MKEGRESWIQPIDARHTNVRANCGRRARRDFARLKTSGVVTKSASDSRCERARTNCPRRSGNTRVSVRRLARTSGGRWTQRDDLDRNELCAPG